MTKTSSQSAQTRSRFWRQWWSSVRTCKNACCPSWLPLKADIERYVPLCHWESVTMLLGKCHSRMPDILVSCRFHNHPAEKSHGIWTPFLTRNFETGQKNTQVVPALNLGCVVCQKWHWMGPFLLLWHSKVVSMFFQLLIFQTLATERGLTKLLA